MINTCYLVNKYSLDKFNEIVEYLYLLLLLSHFTCVRLCETPQTAAHQALPSLASPGKNAGVGSHFLLQCTKVKSESEVTQSCPTLGNCMDCSLPGCSVSGVFQARVLERVAIAFSDICICYCANKDFKKQHQ